MINYGSSVNLSREWKTWIPAKVNKTRSPLQNINKERHFIAQPRWRQSIKKAVGISIMACETICSLEDNCTETQSQ